MQSRRRVRSLHVWRGGPSLFSLEPQVDLPGPAPAVLLKRSPGETPETYLGLLYPFEGYKVYG